MKKYKIVIIVLAVIGLIIAGVVAFFVVVFKNITNDTNKLICTAKEGGITIMYNDDTLVGYKTKNMEFDFDEQQEYAEEIGIDNYIEEFKEWFKSHSTGSCVVEDEEIDCR